MLDQNWSYPLFIIPLLVAAIISGALAFYAWQRRAAAGALTFALLTLAIAEWSFGYALELGSGDLAGKIFWGKIQYLGIVTTPLAWLAFALQFTQQEKWLTRRRLVLLAIMPLLTLLLVWTTERHGLVWRQISLNTAGLFPLLDIRYGPWFWVHTAFSYISLLLGTVLLIKMLLRSAPLYRLQAGALLFAAIAPWLGNGLYIFRLTPLPGLDLTPFAFTLSGIAFGWNLFRFRLLDVMPVARQAIIDVMSDGVIVLDIQNRIVDLNPAAQQIIGRSTAAAIGKTGTQILANWPPLMKHYHDMAEGQAEIALYDADNTQRYFDMRISPLYDRQERPTGRIIVLRDITRRKQAEQSLAQARDQALEASRLKSELLAKVSHELRTPLGAIFGFAELLEMGAYGDLSEGQKEVMTKIISNTHYLTNLVDELLDQAQLASGKLKLNLTSFAPAELVDEVEARMRVLAEAKGLTLAVHIAADMPALLLGDRPRLQQILTNLVSNAIKFTEAGSVRISLYRPYFAYWAIRVSDTGPGIPVEAQAHIFEPFRQLDDSITRKYGGAGLGLSIAKQLTTLMGGQIKVESKLNEGSTFTVLLPLQYD